METSGSIRPRLVWNVGRGHPETPKEFIRFVSFQGYSYTVLSTWQPAAWVVRDYPAIQARHKNQQHHRTVWSPRRLTMGFCFPDSKTLLVDISLEIRQRPDGMR